MPGLLNRIARELGLADPVSALAEHLSPADLQSLLLAVYQRRAESVRDASLMERFEKTALLAPSNVDARALAAFDHAAFAAARSFDALDLSPVAPLGLTRVLGDIDQNNTLTGIRNVDVLSDTTPVLALECARRRKLGAPAAEVRLCASHRVIRLQPVDVPGFVPHFRLFALVSAGRDQGSSDFEIRHLKEHLTVYLSLFETLNQHGFNFREPLVEISDTSITASLLEAAGCDVAELRDVIRAHRPGGSERFLSERQIELPAAIDDPKAELTHLSDTLRPELERLGRVRTAVFGPLAARFPSATFRFNLARLEGLQYYSGLCLRVSPIAPDGSRKALADGGFTNWTARLLNNRKERLLTSGIGTEFACWKFRTPGPSA